MGQVLTCRVDIQLIGVMQLRDLNQLSDMRSILVDLLLTYANAVKFTDSSRISHPFINELCVCDLGLG